MTSTARGTAATGLLAGLQGHGHKRPPVYLLLVACVAVLNVIGAVMVLSASSVMSLSDHGSPWYVFRRQFLWILLGALAFWVVSRIDYRAWRRLVPLLLVGSTAALALVLVPGVGIEVYGSRRWLGSGSLQFQPVEIAKLALLVFTADVIARRHRELRDWRVAVRPVLLVTAAIAGLVVLEPDLDSVIVLALIVGAVFMVGGVPRPQLLRLGGGLIAAGALLSWIEPYRRARVLSFLHPFEDSANTGYQTMQSLIAVGSGGLTGTGLGAGRSKWLFLPNAHTDFIFAVIGEELGLVGCLVVVVLFVGLAVLGTVAASRAPDRFGTLLAAGVTMWIVGQAAINMAMVVGLLPVSGLPLPFVSLGGTALVITMVAAGLLANVARQGRRPRSTREARVL